MKKLLIMLMVVAMASFLFTGCITTPTEVAVTGVTLNQATMTLTAGGATGTLVATVAPATATNKSVTWSSSAPAVATVSVNGLVTPLTAGTTTITVTTVDGSKTATCAVTVSVAVPTVTTVAPIITSVPDAADGYVNIAEAAGGMYVYGTGPTYSEIKLYIDGIFAGTGDVLETGYWSVYVAKADIIRAVKADGAKVLVAKATDLGLPESDASNEIKYTLDTIRPFIDGAVAHKGTGLVYKFVETADTSNVNTTGTGLYSPCSLLADADAGKFTEILATGTGASIPTTPVTLVTPQLGESLAAAPTFNPLPTGTIKWKIEVMQVLTVDSKTVVRVYNLTAGTSKDHSYDNGPTSSTSWIHGMDISATQFYPFTDIGRYVLITTTNTAASEGYVDVTFNEAVKAVTITQSIALGTTWTLYAATTAVTNTPSVRGPKIARLTETTAGTLVVGRTFSVGVFGIEDLASNKILSTAPASFVGVIIP